MSSENVDLENSTLIKNKSTKTYERFKTGGCVELVFPSLSKDEITTPISSSKISDIIDIPSPTTKRKQKNEETIDTPRKKRLKKIITIKQQQINNEKIHIFKLKNQ